MKQVAEPRPSWSASAVKYLQNVQNRHSSTGVPVLFFEMFITRNAGAGADPKVWLRLQPKKYPSKLQYNVFLDIFFLDFSLPKS